MLRESESGRDGYDNGLKGLLIQSVHIANG